MATIKVPRDPNTLSNYHNWVTKHTTADFIIDFAAQKLSGNVTLHLQSLTASESSEIILDTSFVDIKAISLDGTKIKDWEVKDRFEPYGSPLHIQIAGGRKLDEMVKVNVELETTNKCTALQWLTKEQAGGKHYMFSQCQAIHARSLFPCQDTPDVKSTFDFLIHSPLPVIASGLPVEPVVAKSSHKTSAEGKLYQFEQKIPMTSYLFALASGDIVTAEIGPRSIVAAGPAFLKDSKWELEKDTENFIQVAEKLVGPYVWGQYNVLVLPPSFPYGGMENPIFTFATPTIISGDRENVDVIAHELSHSWSGNLVSNASWEHFWLNEGWTTYLERRIQAAVHGEAHRDFSAIIGWKALEDSIELFGADHEFTKLVIDLKGKDPDDAFSSIPYEKGFHFLYFLEKLITRPVFDTFIPHYFKTWSRKSLDSYEFKVTLLDFFSSDIKTKAALETVDWDEWFYKPGLPPKPVFDTSMVDKCYALADKWTAGIDDWKPSPGDISSWTANQTVVFLERLLSLPEPLPSSSTTALGSVYSLTNTRNVELSARYFRLSLQARDKSAHEPTAELLSKVGRMKFVRPLYRELGACDLEFARSTFSGLKGFYHPICRGLVEKDLYETCNYELAR